MEFLEVLLGNLVLCMRILGAFYWSGFVTVGTHTLTVTTIIIFEGVVRDTRPINVDADNKVIDIWINLW
jgi:hypothetical protein